MGYIELGFFPDKYESGALLYRTDEKKLYKNAGPFAAPSFDEIGAGSVPSGSMIAFGGPNANIPSGYLRCDGTSLSTTTYATLFAAIGYEWGGSGANFNLPDLETNNEFLRAAHQDAEVAQSGGASTVTLTTAQLAVHSHSHDHSYSVYGGPTALAGPPGSPIPVGTSGATTGPNATTAGSGSSHENKPPYSSAYFIIKV